MSFIVLSVRLAEVIKSGFACSGFAQSLRVLFERSLEGEEVGVCQDMSYVTNIFAVGPVGDANTGRAFIVGQSPGPLGDRWGRWGALSTVSTEDLL